MSEKHTAFKAKTDKEQINEQSERSSQSEKRLQPNVREQAYPSSSKKRPQFSEKDNIWSYFKRKGDSIVEMVSKNTFIPNFQLKEGCMFLAWVRGSKDHQKLQLETFFGQKCSVKRQNAIPELNDEIQQSLANIYQQGDIVLCKAKEKFKGKFSISIVDIEQGKQLRKGQVLSTFAKKFGKNNYKLVVPGNNIYNFILGERSREEEELAPLPLSKQILVSIMQIGEEEVKVEFLNKRKILSIKGIQNIQEADNIQGLKQWVFPGALVNVIVIQKLQNGLIVYFLKKLIGFIPNDQLTSQNHEKGVKFTARITHCLLKNGYQFFLSEKHRILKSNKEYMEQEELQRKIEGMKSEDPIDEQMEEENQQKIYSKIKKQHMNRQKVRKKDFHHRINRPLEDILKENNFEAIGDVVTKIDATEFPLKKKAGLLSISLYVGIIKKIADPDLSYLKFQSLSDQIITFVEEALLDVRITQVPEYLAATKKVQNQILMFFVTGIPYQFQVFQQPRIRKATIKNQEFVLFNPNPIVTTQVFREILNDHQKKQVLSFGLSGISKTFAYYFYQKLSTLFFNQVFCGLETNEVKDILSKETKQTSYGNKIKEMFGSIGLTLKIPKLFYWTMTTSSDQEFLKKIFKSQCPQLKQHQEIFEGSFKECIEKICLIYQKNGIKVILLIDQINQIASALRQFQTRKFKHSSSECSSYKTTNQKRRLIANSNCFKVIIYNSSLNNEGILDNKNDPEIEKNGQIYQRIREKLSLIPGAESERLLQCRIFFVQLAMFEVMEWFVTDNIIFQIKKIFNGSIERQQVYKIVKSQLKGQIVTPYATKLEIEEIMNIKDLKNFSNQKLVEIIDSLKSRTAEILEKGHQKFLQNLKNQERAEALGMLYITLNARRKSLYQPQNKPELKLTEKVIEDKISKIFNFLNFPLQFSEQNSASKLVYYNLNRDLFLGFNSSRSLKSYLYKLKQSVKAFVINELKQTNKIIKQEDIISCLNDWVQRCIKGAELFFSSGWGFVTYSLLPVQSAIKILKKKIKLMEIIQGKKMDDFFRLFYRKNGAFFGHIFENCLMNALEQEILGVQIFDKLLFRMSQKKKKSSTFSSFPRINSVSRTVRNQQFIQQFIKGQAQGYALYRPIKQENQNSKCIDFVIQKSNVYATRKHDIYFFNATCAQQKYQINKKINMFLQAYSQLDFKQGQTAEMINNTNSTKKKKYQIEVYFVIVGAPINYEEVVEAVKLGNQKLSQLRQKDENSYPYFKSFQALSLESLVFKSEEKVHKFYNKLIEIAKSEASAKKAQQKEKQLLKSEKKRKLA